MFKKLLTALKSKKVIAAIIVVVVLIAFFNPFKKSNNMLSVQAMELTSQNLTNTIQVTGLVESSDSIKVSSSLAYNIESVNVKAGDLVNEGDVLATIDTTSLLLDIQKVEMGATLSSSSTSLNLENAKQDYETMKSDLENNMNSSIVNAQNNVDNALRSLDDAKEKYNDSLKDLDEGTNATIKKAQRAVDDARDAWLDADDAVDSLEEKIEDLEYAIDRIQDEIIACSATSCADLGTLQTTKIGYEQELRQLKASSSSSSSDRAYKAYKDAKTNLEDAVKAANKESENFLKNVNTMQTNFDTANKSLKIAQRTAQQQLKSAADKVESATLNYNNQTSNIDLAKMKKQLDDATVKAPISGTVTQVYAEVGNKGSGLLFVIENSDALKVVTSIKEYDLMDIQNGMSAIIKADAVKDKEYKGAVSFIAPAAKKAPDGSMLASTNVEFECEVDIKDTSSDLKIGMNARVNIVTDSKDNVKAVPYEAVLSDELNQSYVYIAEVANKDTYTAKRINVTLGLETDFMVEILSDELQEGNLVIISPELVSEGMTVNLVK